MLYQENVRLSCQLKLLKLSESKFSENMSTAWENQFTATKINSDQSERGKYGDLGSVRSR